MNAFKEFCQVVEFFLALAVLSPVLLVWWAWKKAHGRNLFDDLQDEDWYE